MPDDLENHILKSEEFKKFLALAYITGILPIKKIKDESALNNFREYKLKPGITDI